MTDELDGIVGMKELLIFELGIYAEVNASTDRPLAEEVLEELSERYHHTHKQINELYNRLNKKYVEVIIK